MKIGIDIDNTITETSLFANHLIKNNDKYNENQDYHNLKKEELKDFLTTYLEDIVYNVKLNFLFSYVIFEQNFIIITIFMIILLIVNSSYYFIKK